MIVLGSGKFYLSAARENTARNCTHNTLSLSSCSATSQQRMCVVPNTHTGGHTAEMLMLVAGLDKQYYSPRVYVVAETDAMSAKRALAREQEWAATATTTAAAAAQQVGTYCGRHKTDAPRGTSSVLCVAFEPSLTADEAPSVLCRDPVRRNRRAAASNQHQQQLVVVAAEIAAAAAECQLR